MADFLGSNLFSPSAPSENFLKTPKTRIKVDESCHLKRHKKAPQSASHGCADKSPQHSSRNSSITGNQLKSYSRGSSDIMLEGSQGCDPKKRMQLTSPVSVSKSHHTPAYENINFGVKRLENIPEEMSQEIQEKKTFELESLQMQPVYQNLNFRKPDPEANHKNAISFNLSKDEKFTSSDSDEIDSHQISSEINDSMLTGLTASDLKAKYFKSESTSVSSSTNETDNLAEVQKQMTRMNIRHLANNLAISNNSSCREMLERNAKNEKKTSAEDTAVTLSPGIGLSPQNPTNTSHLSRAATSSPDSTFIVSNQIHVNQRRKIIRLLHLLLGIQWRRKAKKEDKKSLVEEEETQEPYQEWGKRRRNTQRSQQDRQKAASGNGSVSTKKRRRPRKKNVYRAGRRVRRSLGRGCRYIGHGLANMTNIIPEMSYVGPATRRDYRSDYITPYD